MTIMSCETKERTWESSATLFRHTDECKSQGILVEYLPLNAFLTCGRNNEATCIALGANYTGAPYLSGCLPLLDCLVCRLPFGFGRALISEKENRWWFYKVSSESKKERRAHEHFILFGMGFQSPGMATLLAAFSMSSTCEEPLKWAILETHY